ncbi:hypothetical protein ACFLYL_01905 [Chloroflexota bacterium]
MSLENRIERLEKHTGKETTVRETLIKYPGGEIRHCNTDGPVTETKVIVCTSKDSVELLLRLLNGEGPTSPQGK